MKKKELIEEMKRLTTELSEYDGEYFALSEDKFYQRFTKSKLKTFIILLSKEKETLEYATKLGAVILTRRAAISANLDKAIFTDGKLYQYVGIGHVSLGEATEEDYKKYSVVI